MKRTKSGFTIIELLIVIVVIGILAAIVFISYTGIRQRAIVSSLQSDLSNVSTQLKLFQVTSDAYPTTLDCSTGPNPAPPKICLKASPGSTYVDFVIDNSTPQTFCVTEENGGIYYKITHGTSPTPGRCTTVTTNPINLVANGGSAQVALNWTAPSYDGGLAITGYKIYQGTSSDNETLLATIGNALNYTNTGLSAGTTYYYKVTAINSAGESGYSNEASDATTIATPVAAPTVTVTLNGSNIQAVINPVTCSSGTVQYGLRSRTNDGIWGSYSAWSSTIIASLQTATDGVKYGYQAQAQCYSAASTSSAAIGLESTYIKSITAIPTTPSVTSNTVATTTTWSWPASTGCTAGTLVSYQYDYTITPSGFDSGWTATSGTSVAFTTATGGQTYNVIVQAKCYSAYANGGWSTSGGGGAGYYSPYGNAVAADLLIGKTATTSAGSIAGTMPSKIASGTTMTPGVIDQTIPQGYYGGVVGDGKVKGDANLVASNIVSGASIFGVTGTASSGSGMINYASGGGTTDINKVLTVTGLSFAPGFVVLYMPGSPTYYLFTFTGTGYCVYFSGPPGSYSNTCVTTNLVANASGFSVTTAWQLQSIGWKAYQY